MTFEKHLLNNMTRLCARHINAWLLGVWFSCAHVRWIACLLKMMIMWIFSNASTSTSNLVMLHFNSHHYSENIFWLLIVMVWHLVDETSSAIYLFTIHCIFKNFKCMLTSASLSSASICLIFWVIASCDIIDILD